METSTVHESTDWAIADDLPLEPDPRTGRELWDMYCLEILEPDAKRELISLLLSDPAIAIPEIRSEMTAEDAMFHFDLESLEPNQRRRLAEMLTQGIDPDPEKFNYKLWDHQAYSLSKTLWQIESIAGLGIRAVIDENTELGDELNGSLMAIEALCKDSQEVLEVHLMRPIEKHFKVD